MNMAAMTHSSGTSKLVLWRRGGHGQVCGWEMVGCGTVKGVMTCCAWGIIYYLAPLYHDLAAALPLMLARQLELLQIPNHGAVASYSTIWLICVMCNYSVRMNHFIGWERYVHVYISSSFSFDTNISSCSFSFTMDVLILLLIGVIRFGYSILVSIYIMKTGDAQILLECGLWIQRGRCSSW